MYKTYCSTLRMGIQPATLKHMQTVPRLYEQFEPAFYHLGLDLTSRRDRTFSGNVEINGTAKTARIVSLHGKNLSIENAWINTEKITPVVDGDIIILKSDQIKAGDKLRITIEFSGKITDPMHGLYPCYFEHDGRKKELLATQFESHHAREVFPCIDEPEAKATFDLQLTTEKDVVALSNMPKVTGYENDAGHIAHIFGKTPRMSPYLLAFVVGELHCKSAETRGGVEVNVWATPAQAPESLDFSLSAAVRSVEFFDDYFGVPYPLPKIDHVALPDFSSGAMENWGLITYREVCLLVDENTATSNRQFVAEIIAHETSHQWFGNLVTMKWWDDLWLNESFATLMSYICVDALFPQWNFWMVFATNETLSAVRRDYLPAVQPVKVAVNHPDEITTLFDPSIVYAKGARLLAMLHRYIGDDAFRDGLTHYFKAHAYKNTVGQDLWNALSTASHHDIVGFMIPWLEQPGLPIVHLTRTGLSQERFVLGGDNPTPDALWPIPLAANQSSLPELLETRNMEYKLASDETKINVGGRGHFITHYNDENLLTSRIAAIADGSETDPTDRLTLLHDASLLARAGYLSAAELFDLAQAYQNETSEPVWDIIGLVIGDLKRFVETSDTHEKKYKAQVAQLARQTYEKLGWDARHGESESDTKLRATIIGLLTYADDPAIIQKGLSAFHAGDDLATLPGEIRSLIFAIAAKHGSPDDIERLITTHSTTHSAELQGDIAAGLTATHDDALITRLLGFMLDEKIVRSQDLTRWFIYLIRNRYARNATWQWLQDNWDWIEKKYAGDKSYDDFARYGAGAFSTHEWLDRYKEFFEPKKSVPALARAIELGISDIQARADWIKRDKAAFFESL